MITRGLSRLIAVLFVAVIAMPMVSSFVEEDLEMSVQEKRVLAVWPSFKEAASLKDYFSQISNYTNDHFGYRDQLISMNNRMKFWLGQSPSPKVIRGQNDWLFLNIHDPLLSEYGASIPEVLKNLDSRVSYVRAMYSQLKEKNIRYVFMVAPNKMSVYPENLPDIYKLTDSQKSYRYFRQSLNDDSDYVLHTQDALRAVKLNQTSPKLYYKNDTHWNQLGAYHAYNAVRQRVKELWPQTDLVQSDHDFTSYEKKGGDLAKFIGLTNDLVAIEPSTTFAECTNPDQHVGYGSYTVLVKCNASKARVVAIGDSFIWRIYRYIAESSGELYIIQQKTSRGQIKRIIDELQPDLVIEELVERNLSRKIP